MIIRRPEDLAAAIKKARRDRDLSQAELASRVEVGRQWVHRLENGEPGVSLGLVLRALSALGLSLHLGASETEKSAPPSKVRAGPRFSIDEIVDE